MIKRYQKQKIKKILKIIIPIILILLVLIVISRAIEKAQKQKEIEKVKQYTSIEDFETIEQVAMYFDCEYIKEEPSKTNGYSVDIYLDIYVNTFSGEKSNQVFYERLFQYCAKVLKHNNFIIVDESKDLVIGVICNKETGMITNYYINGTKNYFEQYKSQKAIQEFTRTSEIEINIKSTELKKLINNSWKISDSTFGTKDSMFNNYNIYFNEGISVRKINGQVFNIVFTSNYPNEIVEGITTKTSKEDIIKKLGTPQFESTNNNIIGYKSKDIYMFFADNEISVYRVEKKFDTSKFVTAVEEFSKDSDLIKLVNEVKKNWPDYDIYKYDEDYVYIQYSLKGISIKYNYNNNNGIFIYNNYYGEVSESTTIEQIVENGTQILENMYIKNEDLVLEAEINRIKEKQKIFSDGINIIEGKSKEFSISTEISGTEKFKIKFISKTGKYPNRELRESISEGKWENDFTFVFKSDSGVEYKFDLKTGKYLKNS